MDVVGRSGCGGGFDCFLQNCLHAWCHAVGRVYFYFSVWAFATAWFLSEPFCKFTAVWVQPPLIIACWMYCMACSMDMFVGLRYTVMQVVSVEICKTRTLSAFGLCEGSWLHMRPGPEMK